MLIEKPKKRRKKTREGNSPKHLAFIRSLPCIVTRQEPAGTAHHLKATGARGGAMKSPDMFALPLGPGPHVGFDGWTERTGLKCVEEVGTKNEKAWFAQFGIMDPIAIAISLWENTGKRELCEKIIRSKGNYREGGAC